MNYLRKHKRKKTLFGIIGIIVIPLYSYLLSRYGPGGDLILVTFSQIGSRYGAIENLIIWGLLSSFYYFLLLDYLFYLNGSKSKILRLTLAFSTLSMMFTVFLPFAPSMFPIASEVHNTLAYITAVAILLTLFLYVMTYWHRDKTLFYWSMGILIVVIGILIVILVIYGVSSLFQILLSSLLCYFLYLQLILLERSDKINIYEVLKKDDELSDSDFY
ncbi:MAG: hypothetical protein GX661_06565 [Acholeplasmataceae bacterium]|nr:hypothetical protein [Acholeplasmataceae bacterium]